jgi:hypothetical protein
MNAPDLFSKIAKAKRAADVAQVVECIASARP